MSKFSRPREVTYAFCHLSIESFKIFLIDFSPTSNLDRLAYKFSKTLSRDSSKTIIHTTLHEPVLNKNSRVELMLELDDDDSYIPSPHASTGRTMNS